MTFNIPCGCDIRPDAKPPIYTVCARHMMLMDGKGKLIEWKAFITVPYVGKKKAKK